MASTHAQAIAYMMHAATMEAAWSCLVGRRGIG